MNFDNEALLSGERRRRMLQDIQFAGSCSNAELGRKYHISAMTVRRDLATLEREGLIVRTHGGALRKAGALVEPAYAAKQEVRAAQKARIAAYAAQHLVDDGDIIFLEGGTTTTAMAHYLRNHVGLTVITNGLYTTNELRHGLPQTTVMCVGGSLRDVSSTFVGPFAERFVSELHAHKVFLSATGLTLEAGYTDPNVHETQVKQAMIAASAQTILLLDGTKIGLRSLTTILPATKAHILVTDDAAPAGLLDELRERGVDVRIA